MVKIIICGVCGNMGREVAAKAAISKNIEVVAGIDSQYANQCGFGFPVYGGFEQYSGGADVVIDFSRPQALPAVLTYIKSSGAAAVLAATGYTDADNALIEDAARKNAIFKSANLSVGVNLIKHLCAQAAAFLGEDFDIEIIEKHHNRKADAPSGTALLLADAVNSASGGGRRYVFGRHGTEDRRILGEIGIHAVRGGNIAGEHEVSFIGADEIVTVCHSAAGRQVFAAGAIKAAEFVCNKPAGLYGMDDLIASAARV